jgi:uncharacterized membrane protein
MTDKNKHLVLAFFDNESVADKAVESLKKWDKANADIKVGAIGVLVKDKNGKIKTHKLGKRDTVKGAGVGLILGIIAAIPSGGIALCWKGSLKARFSAVSWEHSSIRD